MPETLGTLQHLTLLATVRLGGNATGAEIQAELEETAHRSVAIATVYVTMDRLERRGLVASSLGEVTHTRGGKARREYQVTNAGFRALNDARAELDRMWHGVHGKHALEGGK